MEDVLEQLLASCRSYHRVMGSAAYILIIAYQVCETIRSVLLIDDSMETALAFGRNTNRHILLFGDYEWNKRVDAGDSWTFDEKLALEGGKEWWKEDTISLCSEDSIWRVRNWEEVLQWLKGTSTKLTS